MLELNSEITVRLLAAIALLAVLSTGVSLVAFQSTRSRVAALTEDADSLREALSQVTAALSQAEGDQASMITRLGSLELEAAALPRLAVADFEALAESLSIRLSSDAGIRRNEAWSEIGELEQLYASETISQSNFVNQLAPLQIKMLVNSVDALFNCLEAMENAEERDTESQLKRDLNRIKDSLTTMEQENQYDADLIAVLQGQLDLVNHQIHLAQMRQVRNAAVSVARSEGYDFVLDLATVIQVMPSIDVPDITEEIRGFLE